MNDQQHRWWYGLRSDRAQRLRIRRFFVAVASYALWSVAILLAVALDLLDIPADRVRALLLSLGAVQLTLYGLFWTGLNRAFPEPALTIPQMLVGLLYALLIAAMFPAFRGHLLCAVMVTMLFGVFRLQSGGFIALASVAFGGYLAIVAYELLVGPSPWSPAHHLLSATFLAIVLLWIVFFGVYVSNLRYRLSAHNEALGEALARNQRLAERDELTGLYNRRFLVDRLQGELAHAEQTRQPVSIALIDLDHFKHVNDRYGHSTGDRVLRDFGRYLMDQLQEREEGGSIVPDGATIGRYGGEEFMLILPAADQDAARSSLERLRLGQDRRTADDRSSPHVTLSAGIAQYLAGESFESLLRRADRALYRAKDTGRNRVCVAI